MNVCSNVLGDVIKRARAKLGMTQSEVADAANVDVRTVLNIENNRGNPKLHVLNSLIQVLNIDAREIFNPRMQRESPVMFKLHTLIENCSNEEAAAIIPCVEAILAVMRSKGTIIE